MFLFFVSGFANEWPVPPCAGQMWPSGFPATDQSFMS